MSSRAIRHVDGSAERQSIPFYRNVKTLALLAQVIFVLLAALGIWILYRNITTGLASSGLTFTFNFLGSRAGFELGETTIPYSASDTYLKALVVGFLNTLKVGIAGVILCTLLGVMIGVMRVSANWLLSTFALWYVELLRNTPLAVQLIFWYYAIILSIPPRSDNSLQLPGSILVSQIGIALPWVYPTGNFGNWLPWLVGALAVASVAYALRVRQLRREGRFGNRFLVPFIAFALVAGVGYYFASSGNTLPGGTTATVDPLTGSGRVFVDENDNGVRDAGERLLSRVPVTVRIPEARLETISSNVVESREAVYSTFRFPLIQEREFESAEVIFRDPEAAAGLSIHFDSYPSIGVIYRDLNGNGVFDAGEEIYYDANGNGSYDPGEEVPAEGARIRGYNGVGLAMEINGFERRVVSDQTGALRLPIFRAPPAGEETAVEQSSPGGLAGGLGGLFQTPAQSEAAPEVEASTEVHVPGPLVYSEPTVPRSSYFGGAQLSTPFLALLLGLAIYTSAFVAEIVRAGIQAVPRGQSEAAKALGLSGGQTFRLIIFPQALRVIIPPMISQYLNLTKNSSLAVLVTFSDFFLVSNTVGNQTGQFVSVYVIILVGYLFISLVFSLILNVVNRRVALVER